MKQGLMFAALTVVLVGIAHAQRPGGSGSGGTACPNQQAADIPAVEKQSDETTTCGIGVVAFGIGGGLFGEECPKVKHIYPAHQKCQGDTLEGHKCVVEDPIDVIRQECECGGLVIPWLEVGVPAKCVCEVKGDGGKLEDFKTEKC